MIYEVNEQVLNEAFNFLKKKKSNHKLTEDEIKSCINIAKKHISNYPKLKKLAKFVNINKPDDFDDESPLDMYIAGESSYIIIMKGDVHDGGYGNLSKGGFEQFQEDENSFCHECQKEIDEKGIKVIISETGNADWDGCEIALSSKK